MSMAVQDAAELRALYQELILDHARHPRHYGKLETATHSANGVNPLCGDKLKLYLKLDGDGSIVDASFEGSGCAISVASASLLTDRVIGLTKPDALDTSANIIARLTGQESIEGKPEDKLTALEGVKEFPARVKCATLAWHAFTSALNESPETATTE